jgi:hypothetical protein
MTLSRQYIDRPSVSVRQVAFGLRQSRDSHCFTHGYADTVAEVPEKEFGKTFRVDALADWGWSETVKLINDGTNLGPFRARLATSIFANTSTAIIYKSHERFATAVR